MIVKTKIPHKSIIGALASVRSVGYYAFTIVAFKKIAIGIIAMKNNISTRPVI